MICSSLRCGLTIGIGGIDSTGEERRGVLEYDLAGIAGTVISATIAADFLHFSLPHPNLEVFVHSAGGLVTLSDMTAKGTLVFQDQISGAQITADQHDGRPRAV